MHDIILLSNLVLKEAKMKLTIPMSETFRHIVKIKINKEKEKRQREWQTHDKERERKRYIKTDRRKNRQTERAIERERED